uniref:Uncharacterized protein n=1 Tax=Anopheles minimus TaxID=112268 RepID=A0A182WPD3_9DIPT
MHTSHCPGFISPESLISTGNQTQRASADWCSPGVHGAITPFNRSLTDGRSVTDAQNIG